MCAGVIAQVEGEAEGRSASTSGVRSVHRESLDGADTDDRCEAARSEAWTIFLIFFGYFPFLRVFEKISRGRKKVTWM